MHIKKRLAQKCYTCYYSVWSLTQKWCEYLKEIMGRFGWPYIYDLAKPYSLINDLASSKIFLINWILCAIFTWKTMHNTIYSCFRIIISYFVLWNILFKVSTKSVLFSAIAESLDQIKIPHAVFVVNRLKSQQ